MSAATAKKDIVSVIIPVYNEEQTIQQCLDSLADQSYKDIEVIVVDDFSSDKTSVVVRQWAKKSSLKLKVILNKGHRERGVTRNLGAKLSKGSYLLFIDSDMQISKRAISDCIKLIKSKPEFRAVIIPEESFGVGFWAKCKSLEKRCYIGDDRMEAARFFETKAFWHAGGWDNKMISGEDWDLTHRVRSFFQVGRINSLIFHNEYNLSLWKAIKKKYYYASVSGIYLKKNPLNLLNIIFFVIRPSFIRNWRVISSDPLHGIGMLFLKLMELFAGGAGYLVSRLPNPL